MQRDTGIPLLSSATNKRKQPDSAMKTSTSDDGGDESIQQLQVLRKQNEQGEELPNNNDNDNANCVVVDVKALSSSIDITDDNDHPLQSINDDGVGGVISSQRSNNHDTTLSWCTVETMLAIPNEYIFRTVSMIPPPPQQQQQQLMSMTTTTTTDASMGWSPATPQSHTSSIIPAVANGATNNNPQSVRKHRSKPLLSRMEAQLFLQVNALTYEMDALTSVTVTALQQRIQQTEFSAVLQQQQRVGDHHPYLRPLVSLLHLYHDTIPNSTIQQVSNVMACKIIPDFQRLLQQLRQCSEQNWTLADTLDDGMNCGGGGYHNRLADEKRKLSDVQEEVCQRIEQLLLLTAAAAGSSSSSSCSLSTSDNSQQQQQQHDETIETQQPSSSSSSMQEYCDRLFHQQQQQQQDEIAVEKDDNTTIIIEDVTVHHNVLVEEVDEEKANTPVHNNNDQLRHHDMLVKEVGEETTSTPVNNNNQLRRHDNPDETVDDDDDDELLDEAPTSDPSPPVTPVSLPEESPTLLQATLATRASILRNSSTFTTTTTTTTSTATSPLVALSTLATTTTTTTATIPLHRHATKQHASPPVSLNTSHSCQASSSSQQKQRQLQSSFENLNAAIVDSPTENEKENEPSQTSIASSQSVQRRRRQPPSFETSSPPSTMITSAAKEKSSPPKRNVSMVADQQQQHPMCMMNDEVNDDDDEQDNDHDGDDCFRTQGAAEVLSSLARTSMSRDSMELE